MPYLAVHMCWSPQSWFGANLTGSGGPVNALTYGSSKDSETCLKRPLKGPSQCGPRVQVVSLSRVIRLQIASISRCFSGHFGQVIALSEWSP